MGNSVSINMARIHSIILLVFIYSCISSLRNSILRSKRRRCIDIPLVCTLSKACRLRMLVNAYVLNVNDHPNPGREWSSIAIWKYKALLKPLGVIGPIRSLWNKSIICIVRVARDRIIVLQKYRLCKGSKYRISQFQQWLLICVDSLLLSDQNSDVPHPLTTAAFLWWLTKSSCCLLFLPYYFLPVQIVCLSLYTAQTVD